MLYSISLDAAGLSGFNARFAQVAQSVEQRTENPRVGGSIPPLGTKTLTLQRPGTAPLGYKRVTPASFGADYTRAFAVNARHCDHKLSQDIGGGMAASIS